MFPESENWKYTATTMGTGWDPMVTSIITTYDGGKAMAGFGKWSATLYTSWLVKMWGNVGTNKCGSPSTISGYVTMVMGLIASATPASQCSLTSNAKVQWAYSKSAVAGFGATDNTSYIILAAAEEYKYGLANTITVAGGDPLIMIMGGSTAGNLVSWGLLGMSMWSEFISEEGVDSTVCTAANCDKVVALAYATVKAATNQPFFLNADTQMVLTGQLVTNSCWTAVIGRPDGVAAKRAAVGGTIGSVNNCVKIAVDGYSLSGAMCIGRVSADLSTLADADTLMAVTEVDNAAPYNTAAGAFAADTIKAVNQGSPT